jgi:hypothetical protein
MPSVHQKEIDAITVANYKKTIEKGGVTNSTLSSYFTGCFNDIIREFKLYKSWLCVACASASESKLSFGFGDKPKACPKCGNPSRLYAVGTFQARAPRIGSAFQYACLHLLQNFYGIEAELTGDTKSRLYDLRIRRDIVVEFKGSSKYLINPDKTKSSLQRSGMKRTDTRKKAFQSATAWKKLFPKGHYFILTNSIGDLRAYEDDAISGVIDVTKKNQLEEFVAEVKKALAVD